MRSPDDPERSPSAVLDDMVTAARARLTYFREHVDALGSKDGKDPFTLVQEIEYSSYLLRLAINKVFRYGISELLLRIANEMAELAASIEFNGSRHDDNLVKYGKLLVYVHVSHPEDDFSDLVDDDEGGEWPDGNGDFETRYAKLDEFDD